MNGYFQLVTTQQGTGIKVYPPEDGGTAVGCYGLHVMAHGIIKRRSWAHSYCRMSRWAMGR